MNEISLPWGSLSFKTEILKKKCWFTIFVHPGDGKKKYKSIFLCERKFFYKEKKKQKQKTLHCGLGGE